MNAILLSLGCTGDSVLYSLLRVGHLSTGLVWIIVVSICLSIISVSLLTLEAGLVLSSIIFLIKRKS